MRNIVNGTEYHIGDNFNNLQFDLSSSRVLGRE